MTITEAPVVSIHIPPLLRHFTGGADEVTVSGDTVGEALEALEHEHPGILARVVSPAGALNPEMEVYLGGRSIRRLQGLDTPVELEEVIAIVHGPVGS